MDDLARTLIECAGAKRCSECEGYPSCGGVLNLMLSAARVRARSSCAAWVRACAECAGGW